MIEADAVVSRARGSHVWRDAVGTISADLTHCGLTVNADTLFEGVRSFGHLVKRNESLTAAQFASRIERAYDASEPRTKAVIRALRRCTDA